MKKILGVLNLIHVRFPYLHGRPHSRRLILVEFCAIIHARSNPLSRPPIFSFDEFDGFPRILCRRVLDAFRLWPTRRAVKETLLLCLGHSY